MILAAIAFLIAGTFFSGRKFWLQKIEEWEEYTAWKKVIFCG
ncbi:hypothetical protein [Chryseobacterium gleum]|jgi:hypothetical protein|nr:hypothetical protein [Chryseobacterium gleum]